MDFLQVLEHHIRHGSVTRINDCTFGVTSTQHDVSATIRLLPGRATVDFGGALPDRVPSAPVLRAQGEKFSGSFYASAPQLNDFLREMV